LNGNPITDWLEICRLGRIFPQLEALVLAECPLRFVQTRATNADSRQKVKRFFSFDFQVIIAFTVH
jgi:hypothetical protein